MAEGDPIRVWVDGVEVDWVKDLSLHFAPEDTLTFEAVDVTPRDASGRADFDHRLDGLSYLDPRQARYIDEMRDIKWRGHFRSCPPNCMNPAHTGEDVDVIDVAPVSGELRLPNACSAHFATCGTGSRHAPHRRRSFRTGRLRIF